LFLELLIVYFSIDTIELSFGRLKLPLNLYEALYSMSSGSL